jgi:hypothetical protein
MSYGIIIKNCADDVIIDGTNANYAVLQAGVSTNIIVDGIYYINIEHTPTVNPPVVAIRCINSQIFYPTFGKRIKNAQGNFYQYRCRFGQVAPPAYSYALMLPANEMSPLANNYGIKIKNAENDVIFNSSYRFMRIRSYNLITVPSYNNGVYFTHPYIENPYYIVDGIFGTVSVPGSPYSYIYTLALRNQSNTQGYLENNRIGTVAGQISGGYLPSQVGVLVAELGN